MASATHSSLSRDSGYPAAGTFIGTPHFPGGFIINPVYAVAFSPDGKTLADGGGTDSDVTYLWNPITEKITATLRAPAARSYVAALAFSPDGKTLAVGDGNGSNYLWNLAVRKITATLYDPNTAGIGAVAFSPDGKTLAVGDLNGNTYLWNLNRLP